MKCGYLKVFLEFHFQLTNSHLFQQISTINLTTSP